MSEKPKFWDFYRTCLLSSSYNEYLAIRNKETGVVKYYVRPKSLRALNNACRIFLFVMLIAQAFLVPSSMWDNFRSEYYILSMVLFFALYAAVSNLIYNRTQFTEVPEEEISEYINKNVRSRSTAKKILYTALLVFFVIAFLFVLANSFSAMYIRYLAEGGPNASKAQVSIDLTESRIKLDGTTKEGAVLNISSSSDEKVIISVHAAKMPDDISLFLNGKEIEGTSYKEDSLIWEDDYFVSRAYFDTTVGELGGVNTIRIKSGGFDREWTFRAEGAEQ